MTTSAAYVLTTDGSRIGAELILATDRAADATMTVRDATEALLTVEGWLTWDSPAALTDRGRAGNQSAMARAVVSPLWITPDGNGITFVPVPNSSRPDSPYLAARRAHDDALAIDEGKRTPAQIQAVAYWRYLLSLGRVQSAIKEALKPFRPAPTPRTPRPESSVPDATTEAPKVDPVAGAVAILESLGKSETPSGMTADQAAKVSTLAAKAAKAANESTLPDPVASILAMTDADAHAALARLAAALTDRAGSTPEHRKAVAAYSRRQVAIVARPAKAKAV